MKLNQKKGSLTGKKIIITGASSGIGAILAEKVLEQGALPILIARSEHKLKALSEKLSIRSKLHPEDHSEIPYFVLDVSERANVQQVFQQIYQQFNFIDILVNNAGYGIFEHISNLEEQVFEQMMQVNYFGTVYCTKQVLPSMLKHGQGHIINIASQAGKMSTPKTTAYAATKHAVVGYSNSLRYDLQNQGVRVTTVNPGPIRTPFFDTADKGGNYVKNVSKFILEADYVAEQIVKVMIKPKREVNLPRWMDWGSKIYTLFPQTADKIMGKIFSKYR